MEWLTILRWIVPYAICAAVGFSTAWMVQGLRIDSLKGDVAKEKQKLTDYRNKQREAEILAAQEAEKRRKETIDEYAKKLDILGKDHDAYKRCVAAGKCGARIVRVRDVLPSSGESGIRAPSGVDAAGEGSISSARSITAEDGLIRDCAEVQLQLNQLQLDILRQR